VSLRSLGDFLRRAAVIELLVAFAVASSAIGFVSNLTYGLIVTPITESGRENNAFAFSLFGRQFEYIQPVSALIAFGLVLAGAAFLVHKADSVLWDERKTRDCPHCLSEIPAAAAVCSYCTRDVA
jgi:large conductance mechanosensitive channel